MDRKRQHLLARLKEPLTLMELTNLKQSAWCTTLMGCLKGASDYYDLDWSPPKLFGFSTHAFMINIHADLCPSSPYVWKKDQFFLALRNMGLRRVGELELRKGASPAELNQAETRLRAHLDAGQLCILDFLEHQLIAGYDPQGFIFLQPWNGDSGMELPSLSFGTWQEALDREGWVCFTLLDKEELRASEASLLAGALTTALRLRTAPHEFELPGYRVGDGAWEAWLAGIDRGLGTSHGHWWSGSVWQECRAMAADFFVELEPAMESAAAASLCHDLAGLYRECSAQIEIAKDKAAPAATQRAALLAGRDLDRRCADLMKKLLVAGLG
jgi:hypothetical protein